MNVQNVIKKRPLGGSSIEISSQKRFKKSEVDDCNKTAERISLKRKLINSCDNETIPISSSNVFYQSDKGSSVISEKKIKLESSVKLKNSYPFNVQNKQNFLNNEVITRKVETSVDNPIMMPNMNDTKRHGKKISYPPLEIVLSNKNVNTGNNILALNKQKQCKDENLRTFDNDIKEDEMNEDSKHFRHIQDVYDIEEGEIIEFEETHKLSFGCLNPTLSDILPTDKWSWEMSLDKRWHQCKLLEEKYCLLLSQVNDLRNDEIQLLSKYCHEAKVKAKSRAYMSKTVIGGTVIGCIGRLEAIRSMQPFAILVEEASEVLEPLLFSCIVETTCKLEMIGDHLQLKPSVMSNISFERKNK